MELESKENIVLISGNANRPLAEKIAKHLGVALCQAEVSKFSDGETTVHISESVRGKDVYVIQSTCPPVNDNLMELLIMIDALKRASADRINAVIPYYGYARQDRKASPRVAITAKLVADMITIAGAHRVVTVDLHADQIMGFFDVPVDRLLASPIISNYLSKSDEFDLNKLVVVSPDVGSVKRSRSLAEKIGVPLAIIDKRRPKDNVAEVMNVIGDVKGMDVIMLDDMIDTAGTVVNAATALNKLGAEKIFVACTHAVLSGPAIERIKNAPIHELLVCDTIPLAKEKRLPNMKILSTSHLIAQAIGNIHTGKPVSVLFEEPNSWD